jgi:hypothetical protein
MTNDNIEVGDGQASAGNGSKNDAARASDSRDRNATFDITLNAGCDADRVGGGEVRGNVPITRVSLRCQVQSPFVSSQKRTPTLERPTLIYFDFEHEFFCDEKKRPG